MDHADIQQDSGRYLQDYVHRLERRVHAQQHDLAKIHRQWFHQELDKREKLLRHEPAIIRRIQRDYDKLEDLATERIQLAEEALQLVDRHLRRLSHDLDPLDHPSSTFPSRRKRFYEEEEDEEDEDEDEEDEADEDEAYYEAIRAQRQQRKRKRKESADESGDEPLYCFCRQVSYGEMVACDGEHCPYEWFHMECVGLDAPPKGAWYCDDCLLEKKKDGLNKKMKRKKDSAAPT